MLHPTSLTQFCEKGLIPSFKCRCPILCVTCSSCLADWLHSGIIRHTTLLSSRSSTCTWPSMPTSTGTFFQCCGSGMFIPDPDFYPSRIPDLKTTTTERGGKNLLSYLFLLLQISQNWKLFYFWNAEEKNLGQFSKNYKTFYPKNCH